MKYILFYFFIFLNLNLYAQYEDKIWLIGYNSNGYPQNPGVERFTFDFGDSLTITQSQGKLYFDNTCGSLCDSMGNLLIASNGCHIVNKNETVIQGGAGLNPGLGADLFCPTSPAETGYTVPNSMIVLSDPKNKDIIHFFHYPLVLEDNWFFFKNLLHTVVDLSSNNGNGSVILKNDPIVFDTISGYGLTAVKHANGRDWWVVAKEDQGNKFFTIFFGADTMVVTSQSVGASLNRQVNGEMVFSPDGTKVAMYEPKFDLFLYDFDRCSGIFSNPVHIPIIDPDSIQNFGGAAWSADGRFLYCSTVKRIYQFDMQASDLAASMVLVAVRNAGGCPNNPTPSPVDLSYMELTPDGRIFSTGLSTYKCMHIIQNPEQKGEECMVEQGVVQFPHAIRNLPHFPNFRLGPIDGSACDTLGLDNHPLAGWRYEHTGGKTVDFTSVSWYEPTEWHWDFGDGSVAVTERNPTHTFPATGGYEVCLTVSNAYGSDTKCKKVYITTTGSMELEVTASRGVLYPNPTTGTLGWKTEGIASIRLYNSLGQIVMEKSVTGQNTDLGNVTNGLYRIQLLDALGVVVSVHSVVVLN